MNAEEIQLERRIAQEKLNAAYRKVFGRVAGRRSAAQKRVMADFDAILKANVFLPDKNGHYDRTRAAIEDGSRKRIVDILKRVNSKPETLDAADTKPKPKVEK